MRVYSDLDCSSQGMLSAMTLSCVPMLSLIILTMSITEEPFKRLAIANLMKMSEDKDQNILALDADADVEKTVARSGTMSRIHFALGRRPRGLTLEEICDITHLKPGNVRIHGLRNLFHFQMVEKIEDENRGTVYTLPRVEISLMVTERDGSRGLEDVRLK